MHYCSRRHHLFSTTDLPVHAQTCPLSSFDISVTFTGTNSSLLQMYGKERFDWSQTEGARTVKRNFIYNMTTLASTIVQFITVNMVVSIRSEVAEDT